MLVSKCLILFWVPHIEQGASTTFGLQPTEPAWSGSTVERRVYWKKVKRLSKYLGDRLFSFTFQLLLWSSLKYQESLWSFLEKFATNRPNINKRKIEIDKSYKIKSYKIRICRCQSRLRWDVDLSQLMINWEWSWVRTLLTKVSWSSSTVIILPIAFHSPTPGGLRMDGRDIV